MTLTCPGVAQLAIASWLLLGALPVAAQVEPKCTSTKLKYEGKAAGKVLKCYARAATKQEAVDIECIQKALLKLDEGFAKAEEDGDCYDGSAFRSLLVSEVESGIAGALYPAGLLTDAQFECASAKLKAAAKLASKAMNCQAKAAKKATVVDPACLLKAATKFNQAFQEAESVGGCAANGNAAAVEAYVGQFTGGSVGLLTEDVAPIRCCAASATIPFVGSIHGCADLELGKCTSAAVLLSSVGGTAMPGPPGNVCNGAAGACAAVRTGTSTCCEASKNGLKICAEGPDLQGCHVYNNQGGVTFTEHSNAVCIDDQYDSGMLPRCVP